MKWKTDDHEEEYNWLQKEAHDAFQRGDLREWQALNRLADKTVGEGLESFD